MLNIKIFCLMKKILLLFLLFPISLFPQEDIDLDMKLSNFDNFSLRTVDTIDANTIVNVFDNGYYISFEMDLLSDFYLDSIIVFGDKYFHYSPVYNNIFDISDFIGRPRLPTKTISLQIPGELYNELISINVLNLSYEDVSLNGLYTPFQDTIENDINIDFVVDEDYYFNGNNSSLNDFVSISIPYKNGFSTGVDILINPIQYNPLTNTIRVIKSLEVEVPLMGKSLWDIHGYELLDAKNVFDPFAFNNTFVDHSNSFLKNYIIIIPDESYREFIQEYVDYKESEGFDIDVITLNYIKNEMSIDTVSNIELRNFLRQCYFGKTYSEKPRYLLLVGNYDLIPVSYTVYEDNSNTVDYYTDIYYGCLENPVIRNENNFYPEIKIGRWPVNNIEEFKAIINKSIIYESNVNSSNFDYKYMLVSGLDNDTLNSSYNRDKYNCIKDFYEELCDNNLINGKLYDGRNYSTYINNLADTLRSNIKSNLWMLIYCGHGGCNTLWYPFIINQNNLYYYAPYDNNPPIAMSFACLTNRLSSNTCYGKSWLCGSEFYGGVTHYGATGLSYKHQNESLSKIIAKHINPSNYKFLSSIIHNATGKYYASNKNIYRKQQVEKYALFGDPTLIIRSNITSNFAPKMDNEFNKQDIFNIDNNLVNINYSGNNGLIVVYNMLGQIILKANFINEMNCLNLDSLPEGIYNVVLISDTIYSTKIYVKH